MYSIREQKNAGNGTFLRIVKVRADHVYDISFMESWKKGYTFPQAHIAI